MSVLDFFRRRPEPRTQLVVNQPRRRGFNGARSDRFASGWTVQSENINQNLRDSLGVLRARSRDQYLNNDFVKRFVSMSKANIVGPRGVVLQARSANPDGRLDVRANQGLEAAWLDWGRKENCDVTGKCAWTGLQALAISQFATDGEILARHVVGRPAGGPFGYRVQMLDTELLDHRYNEDGRNGNKIRLGVEVDAWGRAVAYHFKADADAATAYFATNGRPYIREPAENIIHAFGVDHVGQLRGYPAASTALVRLKMVDGYFEAALAAARAGAAKMGFITTPDGDSYTGDDTDADGAAISDFESGVIEELAQGQSFTGFDPRYPHEQFPEFIKVCLQTISGSLGQGISYQGLSGNLEGTSWSSGRIAVVEEREAWKCLQEWFIEVYCRPIFERWLTMALTSGMIVSGGAKPLPLRASNEEKYRSVTWQARRWAWVDPAKDMDASVNGVNNGIGTVSAIIRERGDDPDAVFSERAAELDKMRTLGIVPAPASAPAGADTKQQETAVNDGEQ